MITAVDTSVLLDVFTSDRAFGPASKHSLDACLIEGSVIACEVVWAEIAGCFPATADAVNAMDVLGIDFRAIDASAALAAGAAWNAYRKRGGVRQRVIADFLVGAHALEHADRLLTRDRGFYRGYFRGLHVLDPTRS